MGLCGFGRFDEGSSFFCVYLLRVTVFWVCCGVSGLFILANHTKKEIVLLPTYLLYFTKNELYLYSFSYLPTFTKNF